MKKFLNGQRVQINKGPLEGLCGTVRRLRRADDGAWVECDERPLPQFAIDDHATFPFPLNDEHGRGKHTMVYPEDCIALRGREGHTKIDHGTFSKDTPAA